MNVNINKLNQNTTKTRGKTIKKTKTKSNNNLKTHIKEIRKEKGLTQDDLASIVGVSRQTINAIEKGDYNPTINLCIAICKALNKTLDELFWE